MEKYGLRWDIKEKRGKNGNKGYLLNAFTTNISYLMETGYTADFVDFIQENDAW